MSDYRRIIITGTLTTQSNLHIGSGEEQSWGDGEEAPSLGEKKGSSNIVVGRETGGQPYIPASSLRGYLRSEISDPTLRQAIFGLGRQPTESAETGNVGHLRLYDAHLLVGEWSTDHISRTRIDPLTQAAKEHHLSTHEVIPPGTGFDLTLELDDSTEEEVKALLQALASLGENTPGGQLGKGKSIGQGRMVWRLSEIRGLSKENLKRWLQPPPAEKPGNKKGKRAKSTETNKSFSCDTCFVSEYFDDLTNYFIKALDSATGSSASVWNTIVFSLNAHSPILINDPERVKQRQQALKKGQAGQKSTDSRAEKETSPDAIYRRHQGQVCIPGSTLKGWLRAHCRRILLTILSSAEEAEEQNIDLLLASLFGSTDEGRGILQFEDALADIDGEKDLHPQTFIAVDRFTGGAKAGALYNVEAVWPQKPFSGKLHYRKEKLQAWMKMLLLYALRDAMEGDLVLGWGKSRGYGRLTLEPVGMALDRYSEEQLTAWQEALQERLKQEQAA